MSFIPVYSIVAYSNTGKTTLLEKLIPELKRRGFRAAVIKHDAHEFEIDHEGKDSWRLTKAGAEVTVIASQTKAAVMENRFVPIEELIDRIRDVDVILTEGYKHGPWPKIALQRSENGKPLPLPPEECVAIMTDVPVETKTPCLGLNEISALADMIVSDVQEKKKNCAGF
jgi:molybdopterin-guanine dinucleotide biosynthesis protein MobB